MQNNYYKALYKAYIKSNMVYYSKYITLYILLNLTLDRFMGICKKDWHRVMLKYSKFRLMFIWVLVTVSIIPGIAWGEINLVDGTYEARSISRVKVNPKIRIYKGYILIAMLVLPAIVLMSLSGAITYKVIKTTRNLRHRCM